MSNTNGGLSSRHGLGAFTLIELLIVIVIIGVLATSLIPRIKGIQDKARFARVEKDFQDIKTAIFLAQSNTGKPLKDITETISSEFPCRGIATPLSNLPTTHSCKTNRIAALRKIEEAAGLHLGSLSSLSSDPRGSPYLLNENQSEYSDPCARLDNIRTAGPNRVSNLQEVYTNYEFSGDIVHAGDDLGYSIKPLGCPGGY